MHTRWILLGNILYLRVKICQTKSDYKSFEFKKAWGFQKFVKYDNVWGLIRDFLRNFEAEVKNHSLFVKRLDVRKN